MPRNESDYAREERRYDPERGPWGRREWDEGRFQTEGDYERQTGRFADRDRSSYENRSTYREANPYDNRRGFEGSFGGRGREREEPPSMRDEYSYDSGEGGYTGRYSSQYGRPNRYSGPQYGWETGRPRYSQPYEGSYSYAGFGGFSRRPQPSREEESAPGRTHAGKGPKGYRRSDDRIAEDVSEWLTQSPDVDATEIEVAVTNGEVKLSGTVTDRHAKRVAEELAEYVSGVKDVRNEIRVQQREFGQRSNEPGGQRWTESNVELGGLRH